MKYLIYILVILPCFSFAQDSIPTSLISSTSYKLDQFVGVDALGASFFINEGSLIKIAKDQQNSYSRLQLGEIASAQVFNPLKLNLFYKAFNSVIILDNRLAEVTLVDFNPLVPYKHVTHVSTGSDTSLWIFDAEAQRLELFDYKNNSTRAKTGPIASEVLDLTSNYNNCWLLTKDYLYSYNYFGALVSKIENKGYTSLAETNDNIILRKENSLYYWAKNSQSIQPISTPNLLISQFSVTNEIVYIYAGETLHQYQLKLK